MKPVLRAGTLAFLVLAAGCCGYYAWGYGYCDPYDPYCYDDCYGCAMGALAASDFDEDGALDLATADDRDGTLRVRWGGAAGGLEGTASLPVGLPAGSRIAAVRADGDGYPDLLVLAGSPRTASVWHGDGVGGFAPPPAPLGVSEDAVGVAAFAVGRVDGDALDDWVLVGEDGRVRVVLAGDGDRLAAREVPAATAFLAPDAPPRLPSVRLALADFDGRGGADLVVVDGVRVALVLLPGLGDGTFGSAVPSSFESLGDLLDAAAVCGRRGSPHDLALLFGRRSDPSAEARLVVVRPKDGSVVVGPMPVGTARALLPCDLEGDGLTDLLLPDGTGELRTLRAHRR